MAPHTTDLSTDVQAQLAVRVVAAVHAAFERELTLDDALIRPSAKGRDADYQSSVAMKLGKELGIKPLEVAERIAAELTPGGALGVCEVSPPGFLNLVVARDWLEEALVTVTGDPRLGVPLAPIARRVVIDYSAPNVAKEMHVGHLRSTIIGDALARIVEFAGDDPIAQNHVGDWGTPFGMLLEYLDDMGWDAEHHGEIEDLDGFYREARARFDGEPGFADRARQRVVRLQREDPETIALWHALVDESKRHFNEVYGLLGVRLTDADLAGESVYRELLAGVVDDLLARGVAVHQDGAVCVFPDGFLGRDDEPLPLILRKTDGGYTYGATDMAAIRHRVNDVHADQILYVVGAPQQLHLSMVFASARLAGWLPDTVDARHVAFGSVLGSDGKMLRTRAGATVKLIDLLNEATQRAAAVLAERSPDVDAQDGLARAIGIGAVKYADLSTDREKDYTFSFERMLALEGNTSVYLQYANARTQSVLRKAGDEVADGPRYLIGEPAERALVLQLLAFPAALASTVETMQPHKLCGYLYDTAVAFSTFYNDCPILAADTQELRASRLGLTQLTHRVLVQGLDLLGIEAPDRL